MRRQAAECFRAAIGSEVPEPEDLRSVDGILKVDLAFRSFVDSKGEVRFCYVTPNGKQSPTLRVKPGDTVILNFKNEATATPRPSRTVAANGQLGAAMSTPGGASPAPTMSGTGAAASGSTTEHDGMKMGGSAAPCATGAMRATSTNLHFHGLTVPAECHQDDVMRTLIDTGSAPLRIPIPDSGGRAAGIVLVSPAHSRIHKSAGDGRRVRRH